MTFGLPAHGFVPSRTADWSDWHGLFRCRALIMRVCENHDLGAGHAPGNV